MEKGGRYQNIRVYYERLLVRRIEAKDEYTTGIVKADQYKRKSQEGIVLAVDPEGRFFPGLGFVPLRVKVGDHVLFGMHAGTEVELLDGSTAFIVREDEIAGAVDERQVEEPAA